MALAGKVALITGSTSGIGFAIARGFAAAGCDVVITGLGDPAEIDALTQALAREHNIRAVYISADVAKPGEIRALLANAAQQMGIVQILVNNAGVQHVAHIDDFPEAKWDQIIAINLSAAFHASKAVLPTMKAAGWGRIINIASAHGLVASAGKAAYVAAKHGLIGLTKVAALENARSGVTVNAICPGWVRTPLVEKQVRDRASLSGRPLEEEEAQLIGEKQPLPVFTTPEQIADLALYLCSESAATITGAAVSIDGGWVAQ